MPDRDPVEVEADAGDLIAECITEQYGERCPDFEPGCYCCQAWAQYDALRTAQARGAEGMREAAADEAHKALREFSEHALALHVAERIRALPLPASPWPKVKAIRWEQPDLDLGNCNVWLGHGTEVCQFDIRFDPDTNSYWMPGDDEEADEFETLDAAKAAAQDGYERMIRSVLDLPTPPTKDD